MMHGGDARYLKKINTNRLLNQIRLLDPADAPALSELTGFQPSTITNLLRELKQWNLIRLQGRGASTRLGGKPPQLWELNPNYGFFLGLWILPGTLCRLVLTNFKREILFQEEYVLKSTELPDNVQVREWIEAVLNRHSVDAESLLGLGIALPTDIYQKKAYLYVKELNNGFSCPIQLTTPSRAGAMALKWFYRPAMDCANIAYFTIEPGGTGICLMGSQIINHHLVEGASGLAGMHEIPLLRPGTELLSFEKAVSSLACWLDPGFVGWSDLTAENLEEQRAVEIEVNPARTMMVKMNPLKQNTMPLGAIAMHYCRFFMA